MVRVAGIIVAVGMAVSAVARADVAQDRAAELFDEGQRLIVAGKVDEACAKFAASFAVDPAVGTKLNLADCSERQGKLLAALALFEEVELEAARTGADKVSQARLVLARERIALLARKLAKVQIRIGEPERTGLIVWLDAGGRRRTLSRETWSKPQVVEPGEIVVEASAPGHRSARIERRAVADSTLTLDIPSLEPLQRAERTPSLRIAAYVSAGTGAALLVTSISLGLHAKAKYDHALAELRPDVDQEIDSAQHRANIATALAVAGAVGIAVGVVLYVRTRNPIVVTPSASDGVVGLAAAGRF